MIGPWDILVDLSSASQIIIAGLARDMLGSGQSALKCCFMLDGRQRWASDLKSGVTVGDIAMPATMQNSN